MSPDRPSWRQTQTIALKQAIQTAALRLFAEHGYTETTIGMIAEEVGVAERTCYRHFPSKPDLVLWDAADYDLLVHFGARPAEEGVLTAFREALRAGYATLTAEQRALERRRSELIAAIPEVRAAHLDHLTSGANELITAVARRCGRKPADTDVIALSGAIIGIMMLSQLTPPRRGTDPVTATDQALARLEAAFGTL